MKHIVIFVYFFKLIKMDISVVNVAHAIAKQPSFKLVFPMHDKGNDENTYTEIPDEYNTAAEIKKTRSKIQFIYQTIVEHEEEEEDFSGMFETIYNFFKQGYINCSRDSYRISNHEAELELTCNGEISTQQLATILQKTICELFSSDSDIEIKEVWIIFGKYSVKLHKYSGKTFKISGKGINNLLGMPSLKNAASE